MFMDTANIPPPPPEEWLSSLDALRERRNTFVVRIHIAPSDETTAQPAWRGTVEHIQSETRANFTGWRELNQFIALRSGASPPPLSWSARLAAVWRASRVRRWFTRDVAKQTKSFQRFHSI